MQPARKLRSFASRCLLVLGGMLLAGVLLVGDEGPMPRAWAQQSPKLSSDAPRSHEIVLLDCESEIGRREITLFENGTVRLRLADVSQDTLEDSDLGGSFESAGRRTEMHLGELSPEDLERFLGRLRVIDLSETEESYGGIVEGEWIGQCLLSLDLGNASARTIRFGRYDSLNLALSRVVKIVEELPERVHLEATAAAQIPTNYHPEIGDILERQDGHLFEVVLHTSDGLGVELQGLQQPVTVIVSFKDLKREFARLVDSP